MYGQMDRLCPDDSKKVWYLFENIRGLVRLVKTYYGKLCLPLELSIEHNFFSIYQHQQSLEQGVTVFVHSWHSFLGLDYFLPKAVPGTYFYHHWCLWSYFQPVDLQKKMKINFLPFDPDTWIWGPKMWTIFIFFKFLYVI